MQQKKIILFIVIAFILSSAYLLAIGSRFENKSFSDGWWAAYFMNPKNESLDFSIENHSDKKDFHWKIMMEKEKIREGDIKVEKGEVKNIAPEPVDKNGKIIIEISTDGEKKEIYKTFN